MLASLALHVMPAAGQTGWPMRGFDAQNSGVSPHLGVKKVRLAWTFASFDIPGLPAVAPDGTIYFCTQRTVGEHRGLLWALHPDGSLKWNVPLVDTKQRPLFGRTTPIVGPDGTIYVGWGLYSPAARTESVSFLAFDSEGNRIWIFEPRIELENASDQQPILGPDGTIYIALNTGFAGGAERASIFALDSADGGVIWRFVSPRADSFWATPALGPSGKLYFESSSFFDNGAMYCLDAATGELEWEFAPIGGTQTGTTVDDQGVYLLGYPFRRWLTKLDLNGGEMWRYDLGPFLATKAPVAVHGGKAYVPVGGGPDEDAGLHVLDAATGERLTILGQGRSGRSAGLDLSGNVFFWGGDHVLAYNAGEEFLWESPFLGTSSRNAIVLGRDGLILARGGFKLFALDSSVLIGDLNCDGVVNAFDIEPFILILFDPPAYAARFPDCDGETAADINVDGPVNAFDIEPFLDLLFP